MDPAAAGRSAGDRFARSAARWAVGTAVARSRAIDSAARALLPGPSAALTVVPLAVPSVFISEFPRHALALQAASTARHVRRGALADDRGRAALGAALTSAARLLAADRDIRRSKDVLDGALLDALGHRYQEGLPPDCPTDAVLTRRRVYLPRFSERRRYLAAGDVAYGDAGIRNHLDVWRRSDLPLDGRAPVVVQIHGSAWVKGSKRGQGYPLLAHLAERGWVGVAINYSLAPKAKWPAHIIDVKRALAWVKREIAAHGGDPDFVTLTGGSAGGHLTALAALSAGDREFQPGFEEADTSVAAAVPLYGVYDLLDRNGDCPKEQEAFLERLVIGRARLEVPEVWDRGSPLSWIGPHAPPFFVIHGAIDTLTNPAQAASFADALRAVSNEPVAHAELPGAQHCFDLLPSVRTAHMVHAVDRFLTWAHQRHLVTVEAQRRAAEQ